MSKTTNIKRRFMAFAMNKMPGMVTCQELEEFIVDHLDNNLSTAQELKFSAHLALCGACRRYIEDYKKVVELGKNSPAGADSQDCEEMPESLVAAILEARKEP